MPIATAFVWCVLAGAVHAAPRSLVQPVKVEVIVDPACVAASTALQPMLDANAARANSYAVELDADVAVQTTTELERRGAKVPMIFVRPGEVIDTIRTGEGLADIIEHLREAHHTAIEIQVAPATPWSEVAPTLVALGATFSVSLVFVVDGAGAARARAEQVTHELRAKVLECPALDNLFYNDAATALAEFAHKAPAALQRCNCAISADEFATLYALEWVPPHLGVRSIRVAPGGAKITGSPMATFATIAPQLIRLPRGATISPVVQR